MDPLFIKMPPVEGVSPVELKKAVDYSASLFANRFLSQIMPTVILTNPSLNSYLASTSQVYFYPISIIDEHEIKAEDAVINPVRRSIDVIFEGNFEQINKLDPQSKPPMTDRLMDVIRKYLKPLEGEVALAITRVTQLVF